MSNDSNRQNQKFAAAWQRLLEEKEAHVRQLNECMGDSATHGWLERFYRNHKGLGENLDAHDTSMDALEEELAEVSRSFERRSNAVAMMNRESPQKQMLERQYHDSSIASEADDFVLFRIIGNDLYPRHRKGQSRDNLRFILENEKPLEKCTQRWLVNRIVDVEEERKILALLDEFNQQWVRIPFEADEYSRIGFDMACLPEPGYLTSQEFMSLDYEKQQRVITALYRHKNNYIMNNNGARNRALEEGRSLAKWVLPWDGNCFLTPRAWRRIREDVLKQPWLRYFAVPMTRVQDNHHLIDDYFQPDAVEEPQLIFRKDSTECFDTSFCYGRRPKVELFWRLGIPGKWDHWRDEPWDRPRSVPGPDAGQYGLAGWVARLSSGMLNLEQHNNSSVQERFRARQSAIIETLQLMDSKTARRDRIQETITLDLETLSEKRVQYREKSTQDLTNEIDKLLEEANRILNGGHEIPKHDNKDFFNHSMTLALAWFFSADIAYATFAARLFRRFFFCCTTDTDTIAETDDSVRIEMKKLLPAHFVGNAWCYPDAMVLLAQAGVLSQTEVGIFKDSLRQYLDWLQGSTMGKKYCSYTSEQGTCVDLQIAAIALYVDARSHMQQAILRAFSRFDQQFASDGSSPALLGDRSSRQRCCCNLQAWINLAMFAAQSGLDPWAYVSPEGATLEKGIKWFLSFDADKWPYAQLEHFDEKRLQPLVATSERFDEGCRHHQQQPTKSVFSESSVIRPYWHLEI